MKRVLVLLATLLFISTLAFAGGAGEKGAAGGKQKSIVMVVKLEGVAWFDNMRTGITAFGKDYPDISATQTGGATADPAVQAKIIEDLTAKGVNAILAVPNDPASLVSVFKRANDAGIVTLTHEASVQQQVSYDVEAFDNKAFGEELMRQLATAMHKKGKYIQFVGALSNKSHGEWTDSALAYQKANYPDMEFSGKYESKEDVEVAYQITKDLLKAHPDLAGIQGSAAGDTAGAARAVQEAGLAGKIAVGGTGIPSYSGDFLKSGAMTFAIAWDPMTQGYAANVVALKVVNGETITDGMDLGVPGYNKIKLVTNPNGVKVIFGSAWIQFKVGNLDQYPF